MGRLGLRTVGDLVWHFPSRYEDFSQVYRIAELEPGQQATIQGVVRRVDLRRSFRRKMTIVEAVIEDDTGQVRAVWFNQPYLKNTLRQGRMMNFSGKVSASENDIYFSHPDYETAASQPLINAQQSADDRRYKSDTRHTGRLVPIYPETRGLSSRALRFIVQPILKNLNGIEEFLPKEILVKENFPEINEAISKIHFPDTIEQVASIRRRFAFQDIFLLQLYNLQQKLKLKKERAPKISEDQTHTNKILSALPFSLTGSQQKSLEEILEDLREDRPMNRLLQGDVGSGKTIVAAIAAIVAAKKNFQAAFMAPTEVLANQHFRTLKNLFFGIGEKLGEELPSVGLLTASGAKVVFAGQLSEDYTKARIKKLIQSGEVKIVIGTHALIQKGTVFDNLGVVIIDEQHRFGVRQRASLAGRGQTRTDTQTNAEEGLLYENVTFDIRRCLFALRRKMGLGHKEIIYQKALEEELRSNNLVFEKEKSIQIRYGEKNIGIYRPDFIIEDKVIVELKALPFIGNNERRQIWNYIKGSKYKLALLINFSPKDMEIVRIVYDTARDSQRKSASGPRESALVPHFLSMSATPIPRTLMLTVFGDLDISIINEMPEGRKEILTKVVSPENRVKAYGFIKGQVLKGRQAFVICPRIEKSGDQELGIRNYEYYAKLDIKSVKEEYEKLSKKIFPDLRVGMLHGQMKSAEKNKVMNEFASGKIDILVSTSVVEVGVDIPNATIMLIEGAERFGLAQLYQFRGRVGRGGHQSFCFLFTDSGSESTSKRLKAILNAKNGFELAEEDLKIRGPGQFLGESQTGLPDVAMEALQNVSLIKSSRELAEGILKKDRTLKKYPALYERLEEFQKMIHRE